MTLTIVFLLLLRGCFTGFAAGLLCAVVVTLIDKKPSKEVTEIYEAGVKGEE